MKNFLNDLKTLPGEVTDSYNNDYALNITKVFDNWEVSYINELTYATLTNKSDRHDKCSHCSIDLNVAIGRTLDWLKYQGFIGI